MRGGQTPLQAPNTNPAWPFNAVYLWDAPARIAPALVVLTLLTVVVRPGWADVHRNLDLALPFLALSALAWPLLGPNRHGTLRQWRDARRFTPKKRWMPGATAPTPAAVLLRAIIALAALINSPSIIQSSNMHELVERTALALITLQLTLTWRTLSRSGHPLLEAILKGTGRGYAREGLPTKNTTVALLLWLIPVFCWIWQNIRVA